MTNRGRENVIYVHVRVYLKNNKVDKITKC